MHILSRSNERVKRLLPDEDMKVFCFLSAGGENYDGLSNIVWFVFWLWCTCTWSFSHTPCRLVRSWVDARSGWTWAEEIIILLKCLMVDMSGIYYLMQLSQSLYAWSSSLTFAKFILTLFSAKGFSYVLEAMALFER
jgi:hypothetical protein